MFCGKVDENLVKLVNVLWTIVRWKCNSSEQYPNMGAFECSEDGIKVVACLVERKPAKTVVATEFNNSNRWLKRDYGSHPRDRVFRGCAAGPHILYAEVVAKLIQIALQRVGVRLSGPETITSGDAIAKAYEDRPIGSDQPQSEKQDAERNDKGAAHVHNNSVAARAGNSRLLTCVSEISDESRRSV